MFTFLKIGFTGFKSDFRWQWKGDGESETLIRRAQDWTYAGRLYQKFSFYQRNYSNFFKNRPSISSILFNLWLKNATWTLPKSLSNSGVKSWILMAASERRLSELQTLSASLGFLLFYWVPGINSLSLFLQLAEAIVVNEVIIAPADNLIELKVQSQTRGSHHLISIRPEEPMSVLMQKYADSVGANVENLLFRFDGDVLESDDTPASLDLEGGECIDVFSRWFQWAKAMRFWTKYFPRFTY